MPTAPPTHRPQGWVKPKAWATTTKKTNERGYGAAWRKLRKVVIRRDQGLCQPCKRQGKVTAYSDVDHIIPKARCGVDTERNLQCICGPCHTAKTAAERVGGVESV